MSAASLDSQVSIGQRDAVAGLVRGALVHHPLLTAFDHAPVGMAIVDRQAGIVKVNAAFCQTVGRSEHELLSRDPRDLAHVDDAEREQQAYQRMWLGEAEQFRLEQRYLHANGQVIWVQVNVYRIPGPSGLSDLAVVHLQDISSLEPSQGPLARRAHRLHRLARTLDALRQAFQANLGEQVYADVLRTLSESLQSPAGVFVRFDVGDVLVGSYLSESSLADVRCLPSHCCDIWNAALAQREAIIENQPRSMGCGRLVARSLVVPIFQDAVVLGLLHFVDAPTDYDSHDRDFLMHVARLIAPAIQTRMRSDLLTPRELHVMEMIVTGMTQKQIAQSLGVSVQTVAKHRAKVLEKLRVRGDIELVLTVMQMRAPLAMVTGDEPVYSLP